MSDNHDVTSWWWASSTSNTRSSFDARRVNAPVWYRLTANVHHHHPLFFTYGSLLWIKQKHTSPTTSEVWLSNRLVTTKLMSMATFWVVSWIPVSARQTSSSLMDQIQHLKLRRSRLFVVVLGRFVEKWHCGQYETPCALTVIYGGYNNVAAFLLEESPLEFVPAILTCISSFRT